MLLRGMRIHHIFEIFLWTWYDYAQYIKRHQVRPTFSLLAPSLTVLAYLNMLFILSWLALQPVNASWRINNALKTVFYVRNKPSNFISISYDGAWYGEHYDIMFVTILSIAMKCYDLHPPWLALKNYASRQQLHFVSLILYYFYKYLCSSLLYPNMIYSIIFLFL